MTDASLQKYFAARLVAAQCRAGRALLDITPGRLSRLADVSTVVIGEFERGKRQPSGPALAALRSALENAGVIFIAENGEGAGVRLRKSE